MFGIGPTELIVLLVIGLIVLGPDRLPQVASQVGKAIRDFRRMSDDVTSEFQRTLQFDEVPGTATNEADLPALTAEASGTDTAQNGASDAYSFNLAPQVVPTEPPDTTPPATTESVDTAPSADDVVLATAPIATKADPLAGASLLDEPPVVAMPVAEAVTTDDAAAPADPAPYVYAASALAEQSSDNADATPLAAPEAAPSVQDGIADAWDAVIHTEATRSLPTPEEAAMLAATTAVAVEDPPRPRIDPAAEVTIREVIEAQVAAEAFRERRRLAHYRRTGGK